MRGRSRPEASGLPPARSGEMKGLLDLRARIKGRKPAFVRQESWRYRRVKPSWRRPRGIHSKMREGVKGWPRKVKVGYRGPRITRGLHPSGFIEVLVHNVDELEGLDPGRHSVRVGSSVGARRREEIIRAARLRGLRILNS